MTLVFAVHAPQMLGRYCLSNRYPELAWIKHVAVLLTSTTSTCVDMGTSVGEEFGATICFPETERLNSEPAIVENDSIKACPGEGLF